MGACCQKFSRCLNLLRTKVSKKDEKESKTNHVLQQQLESKYNEIVVKESNIFDKEQIIKQDHPNLQKQQYLPSIQKQKKQEKEIFYEDYEYQQYLEEQFNKEQSISKKQNEDMSKSNLEQFEIFLVEVMSDEKLETSQKMIRLKKNLEEYFDLKDYEEDQKQNQILVKCICKWRQWMNQGSISAKKLFIFILDSMKKINNTKNKKQKFIFFIQEVEKNLMQIINNQYLQALKYEDFEASVECDICASQINKKERAILSCFHLFHQQCLNEYLKSEVFEGRTNLKCPHDKCRIPLENHEISTCLDEKTMKKYHQFLMNSYVEQNQNVSWCPTPNCTVVFESQPENIRFTCKVCEKSYCLKCRCDFHINLTCQQHQQYKDYNEDDKSFVKFAKGSKFKQCPKCKFWVERQSGCPSMKCRCGQDFCYSCGGVSCPHGSCSKNR